MNRKERLLLKGKDGMAGEEVKEAFTLEDASRK